MYSVLCLWGGEGAFPEPLYMAVYKWNEDYLLVISSLFDFSLRTTIICFCIHSHWDLHSVISNWGGGQSHWLGHYGAGSSWSGSEENGVNCPDGKGVKKRSADQSLTQVSRQGCGMVVGGCCSPGFLKKWWLRMSTHAHMCSCAPLKDRRKNPRGKNAFSEVFFFILFQTPFGALLWWTWHDRMMCPFGWASLGKPEVVARPVQSGCLTNSERANFNLS